MTTERYRFSFGFRALGSREVVTRIDRQGMNHLGWRDIAVARERAGRRYPRAR